MSSQPKCLFWALCLVSILHSAAPAQGLTTVVPESVGLSADRLQRIGRRAQELVDQGRLAGVVVLVARRGKVAYLESIGWQDRENQVRMRPDTMFRIASMTKPITSVAVLMLYEEGHFRLEDPVSKFIPEFKDMRVVQPRSVSRQEQARAGEQDPPQEGEPADHPATVPAKRQITIRDLLTHTSGLSYHWDARIAEAYNRAGIADGLTEDGNTLAEDVLALARLPLAQQPGEGFNYGLNTDVLGYLVEVVSKQPFPEFLSQRLFQPLGMQDTKFFLASAESDRLAKVYAAGDGGQIFLETRSDLKAGTLPYSVTYPLTGPQKFYSGGGGLCSTVGDYYRFAQMLLDGGKFGDQRLLSRKTVELMTSTHTRLGNQPADPRDGGFGLGVSVEAAPGRAPEAGSSGTFGWGGFFFTNFFVDPQEEMIGITMAQLAPAGDLDWQQRFSILAMQSVDD